MNADPRPEPADVIEAFNSIGGRSIVTAVPYIEAFDPNRPLPPKISDAERKRIQAEQERREEQERDDYCTELARHAFESQPGRVTTFEELGPDGKQFWKSIAHSVVAKLDDDGRYSEDGWW